MKVTLFETYGQFEWYHKFSEHSKVDTSGLAIYEETIAEEGDYPNGLYLIRSGFVRVSQRYGHGKQTLGFLGKGAVYGLDELHHNATQKEAIPLQKTLSALGYVDILLVPTSTVEHLILPNLPDTPSVKPGGVIAEKKETHFKPRSPSTANLNPEIKEFLFENHYINGTSVMMINLNRCTRCDDCVRACEIGHDNNPRFIRHGKVVENYMIANACMHCVDPVCMIGCPTGAIHRDVVKGEILINDKTCIGCAQCASNCPYDNIKMVEVRDTKGDIYLNQETGESINKATKCDLCYDHRGGPACQRACPHDALRRIDMGDPSTLVDWVNQ